ncbi:glycerol-3-phosphate 1-O-acyltransferase PlsY [Succiniclasticum ruminis]|uniref:Glycerol-3-phosphate acyltransferase n=1 Tax=Succiniclasticum ruminis DSM 9236 TaxID=1123323 RepID=A0A1I1Y8T1_9FIRM|nr:glycerol-3-phosphate 1-O-acyltransferase PlsY [Succiniclasticum ruminis]SFE16045.1 glycerol-3-phosphate acyltransferase PlsY [Succiniclasticum ruminis DSM 9236]
MNYLLTAGGFLLGYVFGSIPCGLWLVQAFHGIDIRKYGSGNIGTTNVFRTVGPKTAAAVLAGDMMKGILALHIISKFSADPVIVAVTALGALLGHNYSLFLGFKGGKGVATGLGLFLYMLPWGAAAGLCVWIIIVLITRYVSLGSVIAAIVAASAGWYLNYPAPFAVFGTLACLFVIIRHKDNIRRLLNGTESKIKPGHLNDNK